MFYPLVLAGIAFFAVAGIRASAATLAITTASVPNGELTVAYSKTLVATGGTQPYTNWSVVGGALPAGITLNPATGVLAGTPTAAGTFNFTARVTDSATPTPATADRAFSLVVASALTVTTTTLPNGQATVPYSQTLARSGGVAPVTWAVVGGVLGPDLSLNPSTGVISGTPSTTTALVFTVRATDSLGSFDEQALTIVVDPANTLAITTASLPNGATGTLYSQTLSAIGGTGPGTYTWTHVGGTLPTGVLLTSSSTTASLAGTPTAAGSFAFTVRVTDTSSPVKTADRAYTVVINPLAIATTSFPDGKVGVAYTKTLQGTGGNSAAYVWSVPSAGTLPAGLTHTAGVVSGTPTVVGVSTFTVQLSDGVTTVTKVFSINVKAAGAVTQPGDIDREHGEKRHGRWNAFCRGSEQGMSNKQQAPAFQEIREALAANNISVDDFCGFVATLSDATARHGDDDGDDDDDDDDEANTSQSQLDKNNKGKGKSEQSRGSSNGKGKGRD